MDMFSILGRKQGVVGLDCSHRHSDIALSSHLFVDLWILIIIASSRALSEKNVYDTYTIGTS